MADKPLVRFIGEDAAVRAAFVSLVTQAGYRVEAVASPAVFWDSYDPRQSGCVVLDVGIGPAESTAAFVKDPRLQHPVVVFTAPEGDGPLNDAGPRASVVHTFDTQDFVGAISAAMEE